MASLIRSQVGTAPYFGKIAMKLVQRVVDGCKWSRGGDFVPQRVLYFDRVFVRGFSSKWSSRAVGEIRRIDNFGTCRYRNDHAIDGELGGGGVNNRGTFIIRAEGERVKVRIDRRQEK